MVRTPRHTPALKRHKLYFTKEPPLAKHVATTKATNQAQAIDNKYHVPQRHWRKWSPAAQAYFNQLFHQVAFSQVILAPPSIQATTGKAWHIVCWNICWLATDLYNEAA